MEELKKLAEVKVDNILLQDDKHFSLGDSAKLILKLIDGANLVVDNPEYWDELPKNAKQTITNETNTLMRYIEAIQNEKGNPQWLASNLDGQIEAITTIYGTLYSWLVSSIREYVNSLDEQKLETTNLLKELKSVSKDARKAEKSFKEVSTDYSTFELSKFFDEIANGELDIITETKKKYKRTWRFRINSYSRDAKLWFLGVILSIIFTGVVGVVMFSDIRNSVSLTFEDVFARALVLAAPAFAIKFSSRNYSLAKNLKITNTHRAVIMKTVLAFTQRDDIPTEVKAEILREAALQAFKPDAVISTSDNDAVIEIPMPFKKS